MGSWGARAVPARVLACCSCRPPRAALSRAAAPVCGLRVLPAPQDAFPTTEIASPEKQRAGRKRKLAEGEDGGAPPSEDLPDRGAPQP